MKQPKVLFICKERIAPYGMAPSGIAPCGISIGLVNSSQFVSNFLNQNKIESKVVVVKDANFIDAAVYKYRPTHVIMSAIWVTPEKIEVLSKKYPQITWVIRIHSKVPFIAHEGNAIDWMKRYGQIGGNVVMAGNSIEFCGDISKSLGIPCYFLPNIYYPTYDAPSKLFCPKKDFVNIGCLGAVRPFKNHLLQAMAAMRFGNKNNLKIKFHINATRTEQNGQQVLQNLRSLFKGTKHELIEHGWLDHVEFLNLVSKMDIGMQVSISETYNIVAADFVYSDISIVVSNEIGWMPFFAKCDPQDIDSITSTLSKTYFYIGKLNRFFAKVNLRKENRNSGKKWLEYLRD
jgi:hypothetical protein